MAFIYYLPKQDRMWRKNRSNNKDSDCFGADLNRNFDANWCSRCQILDFHLKKEKKAVSQLVFVRVCFCFCEETAHFCVCSTIGTLWGHTTSSL